MKHKIINSGAYPFLVALTLVLMVLAVLLLLITCINNNSDYEYFTFIQHRLLIFCVPMFFLELLFFLLGFVFFKKADNDIIDNWMIVAWIAFLIIFSIYMIRTISTHYLDIENEDYVTYTGKFEKDNTRDFIFLNDEDETRLKNTSKTFLGTGDYLGTILYSKRSKYVLCYILNNGNNASVSDN